MKVIMAHNTHLIPGGEDESFAQECQLLKEYGNDVIPYSRDNKVIQTLPLWKVSLRTLWSAKDYHTVRHLIRSEKPDILHVQNTFPLISPAIFHAAHHEGIPTILSLRNYRLYCLNSYFLRGGQVCEKCINQYMPLSGIYYKCYRDSLPGSVVTASMIMLHRWLKTYQNQVDAFITLTDFSKEKFASHGIPTYKIYVKPNFVVSPPTFPQNRKNFFLYVGRLSPEKGIQVLLDAWENLGQGVPLKLVGSGPLQDLVEQAATRHPNIEYLGQRPVEVVYRLLSQAQALIFPSLWYEGMPRTIIEAFSQSTPVIASKLGAMETMVKHQVTGLHFQPGNSESLAKEVRWLLNNHYLLENMREAVEKEFQSKYIAKNNYQQLIEAYNLAHNNFHGAKLN